MPHRHGYSLATRLLASHDRPAVVVLTGVLEPKLATDLVSRGVEHVEFKPVRYDLFAAMVKTLVTRRREDLERGHVGSLESAPPAGSSAAATQDGVPPESTEAAPFDIEAEAARTTGTIEGGLA